MGRELKRKQAKREGKNVKSVQIEKQRANELKPKTLFIILGVLVILFVVLYLITGLFITKDFSFGNRNNTGSDSDTNTSSVSNKILAVSSLEQEEDEYYVYYYDSSDDNNNISGIDNLSDKVYKVDLNDGFNSNYVGESSGIVDNISDLRVENPTIIKVSDGKIIEFYSGREEVNSILN